MADRNDMDIHDSAAAAPASPKHPVLEIDFLKYLELTKDFDMTEDQQRELIEALWDIMMAFVDMGFGIDAVTQACGQDVEMSSILPLLEGDMVECTDQHLKPNFITASTKDSPAEKVSKL